MAIFKQIVELPTIFQVKNNVIDQIEEIFSVKKIVFKNCLIVSGQSFSLKIASRIKLQGEIIREIVFDNTIDEVDRIINIVIGENIDIIIGVGGGKVLDVVKRVSFLHKVNHIAIPTIFSNDGLISPISVLKNKEGKTESLAGIMPFGVLIDLKIILETPTKFIQSAAGDILSNMSATNDWVYASNNSNEKINDIAFQFSRMSAHSSINFNEVDLNSKDFVKMIIQGQINSGIAMGLSGTSRPCSGSEHLISHAIDYLNLSNNKLHGYQVGAISLFCLFLQNDLSDKILDYSKKIGLECDLSLTCIDFEYNFKDIIRVSRMMRPGRITFLDSYDDNLLFDKYMNFKDYYLLNQ